MVALNIRLTAHLAQNWREDLEPAWREFFNGSEPNLNGLPGWDVPDLFPDRLNIELPREVENIVPDHHMLRAFDRLLPNQVRVVIIGQDPYPRRNRATGRAFEDGEWNENNPATVADSLRRLLQSAAALERPDLEISEARDDWASVCVAVRDQDLTPPVSPGFFDALADQGVLSVNAAWTFTGTSREQLKVHIDVWRSVMQHLILRLVQRENGPPTVFLLLGVKARDRFRAATWRHLRANPENNIETVFCAHPTAWRGRTYFDYENPIRRVNRALDRLGSDPVQWWPLPVVPDP